MTRLIHVFNALYVATMTICVICGACYALNKTPGVKAGIERVVLEGAE